MEEASGLNPLAAQQDALNLSELHDAYRTFCEYGWHHLTWKNLAYSLVTYLSVHFEQNSDGELLHARTDPGRIQYLTDLNVETFGYLTKDALWVLFRRTAFGNDYELNLGDHRPFQTPAWQYLSLLPYEDLQVLIVDVANILRDRTTSSHASANILSLTPDWRPTFGAEYGIFRYFEVQLSPNDAASLSYVQLERQAALQPLLPRRKNFIRRALSVRSLSNKNRTQSTELVDSDLQPRTRFSWPLTEKYRRLFPRRKSGTSTQSSNATIRPDQLHGTAYSANVPQADCTGSPNSLNSSATLTPAMFQRRIIDDTVEEEDSSDAESIKSTNTMDSLLDFYAQGLQYPRSRNVGLGIPGDFNKESPIADSPTLAPTLAPNVPPLSTLDTPLDTDLKIKRSVSPTSGHQSFVTAKTILSDGITSRTASRLTKRSSLDSFLSFESMFSDPPILPVSEYRRLLEEQNLLPDASAETNWSGRGQHAEYALTERDSIPLQAEKLLGRTRTAIVESVRCRRVRLVRKTIKCTKWNGVKREDALREIQHLYRAQHAHIVRLVGSYAIGSDLAILTYPCAEWNLEQFMAFARTAHESTARCASALRQFFTCTAKVLDFLHSFPIKHMDIKPQNLLVREVSTYDSKELISYKLYFTDFGISKAYESVDECDTESPTSFTRTYAAQEVVIQESRGLSADMFSLGCVYSEMLAAILDASIATFEPHGEAIEVHWAALKAARQTSESGMRPYHRAVADVRAWLYQLPIEREPEMLAVRDWSVALLSNEASTRPTARQIAEDPRLPFACRSCNLRKGPEDFEAAEPLALTPRQVSPHRWDNPTRGLMEVPALS